MPGIKIDCLKQDRKRKILVIGHARHGKDTVSEILAKELGLNFLSSSWCCAELLFESLSKYYEYQTVQECYNDRHNHREHWHNAIKNINAIDKTTLSKIILSKADIYCGMRSIEEFEASRHLFDTIIWVDASKRLPLESESSMSIREQPEGTYYVDNNGTKQQLVARVLNLCSLLEPNVDKWITRFYQLAEHIGEWSKDKKTKVGSVIVSADKRQFSPGYNGLPAFIDCVDIKEKNEYTVHAEINAITNARRDLTGSTLFVTKAPCLSCVGSIINAGITSVVHAEYKIDSKWLDSNIKAREVLKKAGVSIQII